MTQSSDDSDPADSKNRRKRRLPRWLRWTLEIALLVGVLLAVRAYMAPDLPSGPIPAITVESLSGQTVTLGQPTAQPTVVVFWATWCGICHVEMPWLNSLAKTEAKTEVGPDKHRRIVAIALQSGDRAKVAHYLQKNGLNDLTVVNDPQGAIARRFGVTVTPTMLFFDRKGRIATTTTGITSSWGIRLRLWWLALRD